MILSMQDFFQRLEQLTGGVSLAICCVYPRRQNTGLLEEQGLYISRIMDAFTQEPDINICRTLWRQIYIFAPGERRDAHLKVIISEVMASLHNDDVEPRAFGKYFETNPGAIGFEDVGDGMSIDRERDVPRGPSVWKIIDGSEC